MRLGRHPRKELEGDATGDGRHSSSSARLASARGVDDAVDEHGTCWPVRETSERNIWTHKLYPISTNDQVKLPINPN